MNIKRLTPQNVSQDFVLERLSDYVEGNLSASEQEAVAQYLERDTPEAKAAAQEANDLARMLMVLHSRVPRREPTLDIWQEFNPKMQHYLQEEKMSVADRVKLRAGRFLSNVAAGTRWLKLYGLTGTSGDEPLGDDFLTRRRMCPLVSRPAHPVYVGLDRHTRGDLPRDVLCCFYFSAQCQLGRRVTHDRRHWLATLGNAPLAGAGFACLCRAGPALCGDVPIPRWRRQHGIPSRWSGSLRTCLNPPSGSNSHESCAPGNTPPRWQTLRTLSVNTA
jgi:hypothetical protein